MAGFWTDIVPNTEQQDIWSNVISGLDVLRGEPGLSEHPQAFCFELLDGKESDLTYTSFNILYTMFLVLNPREYSLSMPFAKRTTFTQGGIWLEESGAPLYRITITGTTGMKRKPLGGLIPLVFNGYQHLFLLKLLIFDRYAQKKTDGEPCVMIFRNFKDEFHYFVSPTSFDIKRSASSPFTYDYTIQLDAYQKVNHFFNPIFKSVLGALLHDPLGYVMQNVQAILGKLKSIMKLPGIIIQDWVASRDRAERIIETLFSASSNYWKDMRELYQNIGVEKQKFYAIKAKTEETSLVATADELQKIHATEHQAEATVEGELQVFAANQPKPNINKFTKGWQDSQNVSYTSSMFEKLEMRPEVFKAKYKDIFDYYKQDEINNTSLDQLMLGLDSVSPPNTVGMQEVSIGQNANLPAIANQMFGDPVKWRDLAILNNLKPPYIDKAGTIDNNNIYGTVKTGDFIHVPVTSQKRASNPFIVGRSVGLSENSPVDLKRRDYNPEDEIYGADLALTTDGDLDFNSQKNDANYISGIMNLMQALKIKIQTDIRANDLFPFLGFYNLTGQKLTVNKMLEIRTNLERALLMDSRIEDITNISVQQNNNILLIQGNVVTKGYGTNIKLAKEVDI